MPPVLHVDSDAPLYDDDGQADHRRVLGQLLQAGPARRAGRRRAGVVGERVRRRPVPDRIVEPRFADMWCAALSHCMKRFEGKRATYKNIRSGGVGCFTVDSFPVFDYMRPNVYVIADSNHGYKMIGVGREVAKVDDRRPLQRAATRSASSGSRPATCTRSRTARTPGADRPPAQMRRADRFGGAVTSAAAHPARAARWRRRRSRLPAMPAATSCGSARATTAQADEGGERRERCSDQQPAQRRREAAAAAQAKLDREHVAGDHGQQQAASTVSPAPATRPARRRPRPCRRRARRRRHPPAGRPSGPRCARRCYRSARRAGRARWRAARAGSRARCSRSRRRPRRAGRARRAGYAIGRATGPASRLRLAAARTPVPGAAPQRRSACPAGSSTRTSARRGRCSASAAPCRPATASGAKRMPAARA